MQARTRTDRGKLSLPALGAAALLALPGVPDAAEATLADAVPMPVTANDVRVIDGVRLASSWTPAPLELGAPDLDDRAAGLPVHSAPRTIVAREVLAALLAWEAGRSVGDGAHAAPMAGTRGAAPFGADVPHEPVLGAAVSPVEFRDSLDLSLDGPPLACADVTVDAADTLAFERRTLYQASTGRLFVDFRLRFRDPGEGMASLEAEAVLADAIARVRTLSTFVVESERDVVAFAD